MLLCHKHSACAFHFHNQFPLLISAYELKYIWCSFSFISLLVAQTVEYDTSKANVMGLNPSECMNELISW